MWGRGESGVTWCLHELFEAQAARTPEAVALASEEDELTYAELAALSSNIARQLRSLGVGPETPVGVLSGRSAGTIAALLGVLKAGGAYVPLSTSSPPQWVAFMLEDIGVPVLLTERELADRLPSTYARVVILEELAATAGAEGRESPEPCVWPDNLAYVIYTSGSTGTPKGVGVPHRAVCNQALWSRETFSLGEGDAVLQTAPLSSDVSVWEVFAALTSGARLVLAPRGAEQDPGRLVEVVREQGVTTMYVAPPLLRAMLEAGGLERCRGLRRVLCGGDVLSPELSQRFFSSLPEAELYNVYGPAETTVHATFWRCERGSARRSVPIGRPIANAQTYVLDRRTRVQPVGLKGELYIGGAGLARGYLGRPDLTAEMFVPDPFSAEPGARLYRSGDMARWLPEGALEFSGRRDRQVKVRGFRIELGEIEAALGSHPCVGAAVVLAREDVAGDVRLVAYLVESGMVTRQELRGFLRERLPEHMIPSAFVTLEALPLRPDGKVDRRALPEPGLSEAETARALSAQSYVEPRTDVEHLVASIWAELLGLERVGAEDNFFELGGDSILATRLVSRLREAVGVGLSLRALFEAQTVEGMARAVEAELRGGAEGGKLARVLEETEMLSDEEVNDLLNRESGEGGR
ncbi:MAG TPA: amino acid adenylation domain-containing protein [Pyrinomonadaceae bacterium]|nr:amino acid adenylation domain-containing protein [Pyrinomonadaceae bacterium]